MLHVYVSNGISQKIARGYGILNFCLGDFLLLFSEHLKGRT